MRLYKLSEGQRFTILIFDALWRAHHAAFTISQVNARGYTVNNGTLASLMRFGMVTRLEGQGYQLTLAGRAYAELLQENLLLKRDGLAESIIGKVNDG